VLGKKVEGVPIRVYSPAKTVADCFKYRNKIGLDVALEALRDCYRQRKAMMDELYEAAKVCRVGASDAALSGVDCVKKAATNLPASVRQRLLNLANEKRQDFGCF
jgi:hypothetical protein